MTINCPRPGDLILVEKSEWYALKNGEKLRVCENAGWITVGVEILVAPRQNVRTFWGPEYGPPDGSSPERMSTSGGPFKTVAISDLEGLEEVGKETDVFWCWIDRPRGHGNRERREEVTVWKLPLLADSHYRELRKYNCPVEPRGNDV